MRTTEDKEKVAGATVELVERIDENGKVREYVWQTTTTDKDGKYEFKTNEAGKIYIIPGNYCQILLWRYYSNSKYYCKWRLKCNLIQWSRL